MIGGRSKFYCARHEKNAVEVGGTVEDVSLLIQDMRLALIYWQSDDCVTFGMYRDGVFEFGGYKPCWERLQEIRIFNQDAELHIWKQNNKYRGRWIKNESTEKDTTGYNCIEHKVKLWGSMALISGNGENGIVLTEGRGMNLSLPCKWETRYSNGINAFIQERLYLEEDSAGCVYIADRRFCWIWIADDIKDGGKLREMEALR